MWLVFMRAVESLKICTSIRSFCPNHAKIFMKKYRRVLSHDKEEWYAKFEEKLTCGFKYSMRNLANFHQTTQKSKNFTLMGYFCPKYMRIGLKKYRGVTFHDNEQWCKICINPDHVLSKITWGIGWTFIRALKVWKIVYWWTLFAKSISCFS